MIRTIVGLALAGWVGLAGAARAQIQPRLGVEVPMRDGVKLATDLWLPRGGGKHPVLLIRTPYLRATNLIDVPAWAEYFASRGYVFVIQDVRGRGDSEGKFDFFFQEATDGYDSIEWLATQPFANGKVGMLGVSYLGTVQWLAAREHPPHLACIAPTAPAGRYLDELPYVGGAFSHQWALSWINGVSGRIDQSPNLSPADQSRVLAHRPLLTADSVMGRPMQLYRDFLTHPLMTDYWKRIQFTPADFARIAIPTLTVTGWYDGDQQGAMFYWRGLMANAPNKDQHFLVAGPWEHAQTFLGGKTKVGDSEFGPESVIDVKALHVNFFDWCLKGTAPRFDAQRARIYVTGANEWRTFDAYPPKGTTDRKLYLSSGGRANSLAGDGRLSWIAPADEKPDQFTYDPKQPVPDMVGENGLGEDRRPIQRRDDVLVYTSDALTEPLDVIGEVSVTLEAASDARDTDFTAILTDVGPDGRALKLGPSIGVRRARYRNGYEKEELLTPGQPATFKIDLNDIAHQFKPGHRIRIEISSSAAPTYNPNQNTGNPVATDVEWKVAHQTVYHDRVRASAITLPVHPRSAIP
jgi:putative CocE/NonD family hydrolase